jgi:hypothetical protein
MDPELFKSLGALGVVIYGGLPVAFLLVQLIDKLQEMRYRRLQMRQAELDIEERRKPKRIARK